VTDVLTLASRLVHANLSVPVLYEAAVGNHEGLISSGGALVVETGKHTGRSPKDKFIVDEPSTSAQVWWGEVNQPISEERYEALRTRVMAHLAEREVYVQDCYVGADPAHRRSLRVMTETAWASLFAEALFIRPDADDLEGFQPDFLVFDAATLRADPARDGTRTETFILVHLRRREILIGGTSYAGEIKKSVFSMMNYLLPDEGVLPMHCSANVGERGDVAIFFGLSGTGKTSLSADPERTLVGDDEHGWGENGVFNFEGGCYAKMIRLSPTAEPDIFAATRRFGTILENVVMDPVTRDLDLDSDALTENTRGAYPLDYIGNASATGRAGQPSTIILLTADAFGVLPPISRITPEQAMYHFISGYTAKVAGTEVGVTEPTATFSTCFGAPFMPRHPGVYARLLGDRIERYGVRTWLINTGWTGGPYGVGHRISIAHTRAMVRAVLGGELEGVPMVTDPVFGLQVPTTCPDVPAEVLQPRSTWQDPDAFDAQARRLARMFVENFRTFADGVSPEILAAAPRIE
jgi:phosphoenolpyruvate carboxykinase (ATP)